MDNKTIDKLKEIIEKNKNKNGQNNLPRPNKCTGHTAKRKRSNKTGGVFDR